MPKDFSASSAFKRRGTLMRPALVRPDDTDEASQPVQRLEHRRDECGVAAVARENLADCGFNPADQFLGFLPFLIGHVRFPSASGGGEPV